MARRPPAADAPSKWQRTGRTCLSNARYPRWKQKTVGADHPRAVARDGEAPAADSPTRSVCGIEFGIAFVDGLGPHLILDFLHVAKLPGTHCPQKDTPSRKRHEEGHEEQVEGDVHLDSLLYRGESRNQRIPADAHGVCDDGECESRHDGLRGQRTDEAQE